jgi:hypothetical protein
MLKVGRIVTGNDDFGMGIVVSDRKLSALSRGFGANLSGCETWSTDSMPVDNSVEAEAAQRADFVKEIQLRRQRPGHQRDICLTFRSRVVGATGYSAFFHPVMITNNVICFPKQHIEAGYGQ